MQDYHPRGDRSIDRMTNVPGSRRLLPGLINQTIFPVSTSRFLRAILQSILVENSLAESASLHFYIAFHFPLSFLLLLQKHLNCIFHNEILRASFISFSFVKSLDKYANRTLVAVFNGRNEIYSLDAIK